MRKIFTFLRNRKFVKLLLIMLLCLIVTIIQLPTQTLGQSYDTNYKTLSSGNNYKIALKNDGSVWSWGNISYGPEYTTPDKIEELSSIVSISAGLYNFALDSNGNAWYWSYPYSDWKKKITSDEFTKLSTPSKINDMTGIVAVENAWNGGYLLKSDGTVWFWQPTGKISQVNGISDIRHIYSNSLRFAAINTEGKVFCWGNNQEKFISQFTSNPAIYSTSQVIDIPVQLKELENITDVTMGTYGLCLLKSDGTVVTMGNNSSGELGVGDVTVKRSVTPVNVKNLKSIKKIFTIGSLNIALDDSGVMWLWGFYWNGSMGANSGTTYFSPVKVDNVSDIKFIDVEITSEGYRLTAEKNDFSLWTIKHSLTPIKFLEFNASDTALTDIKLNLTGKESQNGTVFRWSYSNSGNHSLKGFNIYRKNADELDDSRVNEFIITDNTFFDSNLEPGKKYLYSVEAVFSDNSTSKLSNQIESCIKVQEIMLTIDKPNFVVNGIEKPLDSVSNTMPILISGRTFLPIRPVIEELGGTLTWNENNHVVNVSFKTNVIEIVIGKYSATVNGSNIPLDAPARIINDRTMLPLRFIIENLGLDINWDSTNQSILIKNVLL